MGACSESQDHRDDFLDTLQVFNLSYVALMSTLTSIAALGATIYIYTHRSCKEIPYFVSLQMILLNFFWILNAVYMVLSFKETLHAAKGKP